MTHTGTDRPLLMWLTGCRHGDNHTKRGDRSGCQNCLPRPRLGLFLCEQSIGSLPTKTIDVERHNEKQGFLRGPRQDKASLAWAWIVRCEGQMGGHRMGTMETNGATEYWTSTPTT